MSSSSQVRDPAAPSSSSATLGVRKRVNSSEEGPLATPLRMKRPRLSTSLFAPMPTSTNKFDSIGFGLDRSTSQRFFTEKTSGSLNASPYTSLSRASSYADISRPPSPIYDDDSSLLGGEACFQAGIALMRSASMSLLPTVRSYPENSANYFMEHTRTTFDYTLPDASNASEVSSARLLTCSASNFAYFTRKNRVYYKNILSTDNADISQFCRLTDTYGTIRGLECSGETLALGTSKGKIQIWDIQAKKLNLCWSTSQDITALAWNRSVLTVGSSNGRIRHYDTRLAAGKVRAQAKKVTRHARQITCLAWNKTGEFLASGDTGGEVHCWQEGMNRPLEIGDATETRTKKIQHSGRINAVAWSHSQPKTLATGGEDGIMRLWNVTPNKSTDSNQIGKKLEHRAAITGIHFSPHCNEILTTHGAEVGTLTADQRSNLTRSAQWSLSVHSLPSLRHVALFRLPHAVADAIGDNVLDATGTKVIFATPSTRKIDVCDVWAKRKVIKKAPSFSGSSFMKYAIR
ncbi:hypothetical protein HYPSUDRAFT_38340 [Hypholoma sublateritium FD-334 SS-4]|uniref:Uncharacterized protein n=1 Tax=Hypholoma sublateritium (strain FD-334 SS-4) TaxID=945553 RepID=A0A0D2P8H8_HYPSF|nr:hypothetical protein HYPSUDRAFT_38340 [Hypholoma sublateritium FD-334 SS-4]